MLRVAADRAHHEGEAAALRIEQPAQAVVLGPVFETGRKPALDVLDLHEANRPEGTVADKRAGVAGHRIRRIGVRDREDALLPADARGEIARLSTIIGDGLVADDVET